MAKNVVVIGAQWGDEGKGKIVDWLAEEVSGVVRFKAATMRVILWSSAAKKPFCA